MALATFTITNDGQFLLVTSTATGDVESINLNELKDITYLYLSPSPGTYPYADMNRVTLEINGREADLTFDLAAVTNQAGWTLNQAGCIQAESDIRGWAYAASGGGGDPSVPTALVSSSTTGAGTIPAGSKAATIVIDGIGGEVNSVVRPDGWSQTFEFHNDTLPVIPYDGNGTATMYIDILT